MAKTIKGLIEFKYKTPDDITKTIKLAEPIMPDGEKLSHPLEDYFPQGSPFLWFDCMDERERNDYLKGVVMGGACPVFGYPNFGNGEALECHHEYRKGLGNRIEAWAPWAMIPGLKSPDYTRSTHDLWHQFNLDGKGFQLVKWDFLDDENGLTVLDEKGEEIAREDLWWYARPTTERVDAAMKWLAVVKTVAGELVQAQYHIGSLSSQGEEDAKLLGYGSVASCLAQHGIGNDMPKLAGALFDERAPAFDELRERRVIIEAADLWRKKTATKSGEVQDEWLKKLFDYCSPMAEQPSFAAFGHLIRQRFPAQKNLQKVTILKVLANESDFDDEKLVAYIHGGTLVVAEMEETSVLDPEEEAAAGDVIVIKGHRVKPLKTEEAPLLDKTEPEEESEDE